MIGSRCLMWIAAGCLTCSCLTPSLGDISLTGAAAIAVRHPVHEAFPARSFAADHRPVEIGAESPYQYLGTRLIRAYQACVSPGRGTSCSMYPSCSEYGLAALRNRSPLTAFVLTADRLCRCGHDLSYYPVMETGGRIRFMDPPPVSREASTPALSTGPALHPEAQAGVQRAVASDTQPEAASGAHPEAQPQVQTDTSPDMEPAPPPIPSMPFPGQDRILRFASALMFAGDYRSALVEYRRALAYFPDAPGHDAAVELASECLYRLGEYAEARHLAEELPASSTTPLGIRREYLIGRSYFREENWPQARAHLARIPWGSSAGAAELAHRAAMVTGLSYARELDWRRAAETFGTVDTTSELFESAQLCRRKALGARTLAQRRPALAGILAVVPGLGYVYSGYPRTGLSALIVNGLLIWGTAEAGWYVGNIGGSATSARRRNAMVLHNQIREVDLGFDF